MNTHFTYLTGGDIGICADGRGLLVNLTAAGRRIPGSGLRRDEAEHLARLWAASVRMRQFLVEYLWAEHGQCASDDEAANLNPEQLADMAREILAEIHPRGIRGIDY